MEPQTKFGLGQIGNHTPSWANWVFRIVLYTLGAAIIALNTLNVGRIGLSSADVKDLVALLMFAIAAVHGLSKMVGKEIKPEDYQI